MKNKWEVAGNRRWSTEMDSRKSAKCHSISTKVISTHAVKTSCECNVGSFKGKVSWFYHFMKCNRLLCVPKLKSFKNAKTDVDGNWN